MNMQIKNKNIKKIEKNISELAGDARESVREAGDTIKAIGFTLMATAAVAESIGIHGPKHEKAIVIKAESPSTVVSITDDFKATAQRREREEHTPHYSGYNASQRSPGRAGKA